MSHFGIKDMLLILLTISFVKLHLYLKYTFVNCFQEERLQHANLRPSGLRPLFLSTLLVFRWLLQCPIRTSSTVTATSRVLTNLLRSYRTATRINSSLPTRYSIHTGAFAHIIIFLFAIFFVFASRTLKFSIWPPPA